MRGPSKRATPSAPTSAPRTSPTGFPSNTTLTAAVPDASRLEDQVHFAGCEREHYLARALPELDVLAFGSPVALQRHGPALVTFRPEVGLVGDPGVRGLAGPRKHRRLGADRGEPKARVGCCQ